MSEGCYEVWRVVLTRMFPSLHLRCEVEMVCFFKLLYVDVIPGGSRRFREYSVLLFTVPMSGSFFFLRIRTLTREVQVVRLIFISTDLSILVNR